MKFLYLDDAGVTINLAMIIHINWRTSSCDVVFGPGDNFIPLGQQDAEKLKDELRKY